MSGNAKFGFLLAPIVTAIFINGCAGSPMETRMMSPQELTSVTNETLCLAYNFDILWSGKDIPSLQAEVSRRMLNCSGGATLDLYKQEATLNLYNQEENLDLYNQGAAPQFSDEESNRLARERRLLEEERKKLEAAEERQRQQQAQAVEEPSPQSGTGSGFFVSKMGHVITNAHVVQNCNKVTIGDNANKQVPAKIVNTDRSNDLALLQLSTLEMASAESKSLIQKLGIVVVPLASKGLLRSEDVRLGEKVLVAGYPFSDFMSNTIKVTTGVVSATRGMGDDSGQFQLDAAVQPGNSGGPIYDSGGNIVGVVVYGLNKLAIAKTRGSIPENVNFGIKASTVRQFLTSSGLPSKKSERTEEKSTEQLAEIAQNQALMVMCLQ
jgi:S1-C subfamily serine protease